MDRIGQVPWTGQDRIGQDMYNGQERTGIMDRTGQDRIGHDRYHGPNSPSPDFLRLECYKVISQRI